VQPVQQQEMSTGRTEHLIDADITGFAIWRDSEPTHLVSLPLQTWHATGTRHGA
tara:strand:+ start:1545 stop:1706 length:162 start_codon:yes stop_codon:yes gene_type:complete